MMTPATLSFSSALAPRNLIEGHVNTTRNVSSVTLAASAIKCQFVPSSSRRRSFTRNRIPSFSGMATESEKVQSQVVPTSVPVRVAHELVQAGHHYLDVRTPEEFGDGHIEGAVNVPFMFRVGPGMTKNPDFVEEVLSTFRRDGEIIVGCQLGKRSLMAASELMNAGFTGITDMAGGYEAWIKNGLPIENK